MEAPEERNIQNIRRTFRSFGAETPSGFAAINIWPLCGQAATRLTLLVGRRARLSKVEPLWYTCRFIR